MDNQLLGRGSKGGRAPHRSIFLLPRDDHDGFALLAGPLLALLAGGKSFDFRGRLKFFFGFVPLRVEPFQSLSDRGAFFFSQVFFFQSLPWQ